MSSRELWEKLARSKKYREEFVAAAARRAIPFQIRALMRAKGISQQDLAERAGLTQGVISRAANPTYGKLTLNTIIRVAAGLDVAFVGRFIPFSKLVGDFEGLSEKELGDVPTFEEESEVIMRVPADIAVTNDKAASAMSKATIGKATTWKR